MKMVIYPQLAACKCFSKQFINGVLEGEIDKITGYIRVRITVADQMLECRYYVDRVNAAQAIF